MGRNRSRSRSRSFSPRSRSPSLSRRRRMDDPRPRDFVRQRMSSCSLLVRNIARDAKPEDLRVPFERFGPVKDVYLPRDYYSREPRGFGFVEYLDADDAADAQYNMDRKVIGGREIKVIIAEETRKKPTDMRPRGHYRGGGRGGRYGGGSYRRRPSRSPVRRYRSRSRSISPAPRQHYSRDYSHRLSGSTKGRSSSPAHRSLSRSRSPSRGRHAGVIRHSAGRAVERSRSSDTNSHADRSFLSHNPSEARSFSQSPRGDVRG